MKLVSAIVRTPKLQAVEEALITRGIPDVTVTSVAGFAGRKMLGRKELTPHSKVEVILPESQAEAVAECICEAACTGLSGDGIIVVAPIEKVMKIKQWRSRHGASGDEACE